MDYKRILLMTCSDFAQTSRQRNTFLSIFYMQNDFKQLSRSSNKFMVLNLNSRHLCHRFCFSIASLNYEWMVDRRKQRYLRLAEGVFSCRSVNRRTVNETMPGIFIVPRSCPSDQLERCLALHLIIVSNPLLISHF